MLEKLRAIFRTHRNMILIILALIVLLGLLFWAAQAAGKTLWEYLEILIIPVVIGIIAFWYQRILAKRDEKNKEATRERELEIESERQRQATLVTYFDRMSDLLINHNLRESKEDSEERNVARARTISVLRDLDGKRIAQVLQFLTESTLGGVKLLKIELQKANFDEGDLRKADLEQAHLRETNLHKARLNAANLREAYLWRADLHKAQLPRANLQKANLCKANLYKAHLWRANLQDAILTEANLQKAYLGEANLDKANLAGANLQEANLKGAQVSPKQLSEVYSLKDATMPDGTKYEQWIARGKPKWSKGKVKQQANEPEENDSESEDQA